MKSGKLPGVPSQQVCDMTQFSANMSVFWHTTYTTVRRLVVAVLGITVVLLGVVMFITPGPAIVVIPLGLAILATEFVWARRLLRRVKSQARAAWGSLKGERGGAKSASGARKAA